MIRITVVTVTYGERLGLLLKALHAVRTAGATNCIVIDNGSREPVAAAVTARFGDWATTIAMGRNTGSAPGFKRGIEVARGQGADHILLLDDDNILAPDCLRRLADALAKAQTQTDQNRLAVLAYRPDHLANRVVQILSRRLPRLQSSFRGFHLLDLPQKIAWRLRAPGDTDIAARETIPLPWAVYGGLLFHRSLIDWIGLPDERFVLYDDDTEFTSRIVRAGGTLLVIPAALISDVEESWHVKVAPGARFLMWITGNSDLRAFYAFRNGTFSDRRQCGPTTVMFWINLLFYMAMLAASAIALGRWRRFRLLVRALRDGLNGRLGENAAFPLTG